MKSRLHRSLLLFSGLCVLFALLMGGYAGPVLAGITPTPTATPTATPTVTPTITPTDTPTLPPATQEPGPQPTPTLTATPTPAPMLPEAGVQTTASWDVWIVIALLGLCILSMTTLLARRARI